ncbi:MAG: AAA family ATPase [Gammaproteobacteria bacterium]|nr:AAA family ATPase [Gammaproteobacteria bacterium]
MSTDKDTYLTIDQGQLVASLHELLLYDHAADGGVELLQTHISYVFLVGSFAYKIKKAIDLGFLDFRTLSARKFYCEEELRLNRRTAPGLYVDVIAISGTADHPVLGGSGPAIEYAVKMRRFSQEHLLGRLLTRGELTPAHIDQLAERIATLHASASTASADDMYGTPSAIEQPALENFRQLKTTLSGSSELADLDSLEQWTNFQHQVLQAELGERKRTGFVRECHGDCHLGNVALVDGQVTLFDCLEFSANLRWIDVMNEVAFVVMDLQDRRRTDLAQRLLNRYLDITGDYEGLRVLRFYGVYRALVRAKVHALRTHQSNVSPPEKTRLLGQCRGYIALAKQQTIAPPPMLMITHGFSGTGKTTCTQPLLEAIGAVRIRSDVERKRQHGMPALAHTTSAVGAGIYSADDSGLTYERLLDLAHAIIESGYSVIVDATFLKRAQRDPFRDMAQAARVPFAILDIVADDTVLRARILERQRTSSDASEADIAVLEYQQRIHEPLQPPELAVTVAYESSAPFNSADATRAWATVFRKTGFVPENIVRRIDRVGTRRTNDFSPAV